MNSIQQYKLTGINTWFIIEILSFYGYILSAIAFIAESGTQQWGSVQMALQTVAVSASQYTGPPAGVMTSVVNPSAQATMVVGQTVDHVNL